MPDYMYMLESRLSAEQRAAMMRVQELAAAASANVYLTGGAVRDLISGAPIRDLDFTIEGNPARLVRELEKGGAQIVFEDERLRHVEMIFAGDCDGSLSAARDNVYARPGTTPEIRWSTIMEDLRCRDFSLNAIAISLNPASRGLLLDPTNGLSDIGNREIRALSIHSFTNQPVRLLRALRFATRMGFKLETRTAEWFSLAFDRDLQHEIPPEDAGAELRAVAREDKPAAILKAWESRELLGTFHAQLARRHPHYDALQRLMKVRDDLVSAGLRPRLQWAAISAILGRLKSRERSAALSRMGFRSAEAASIIGLEEAAAKAQKMLARRKTAAPGDAYRFLEKLPLDQMAVLLAESSNSKALGKIRNYIHKWRPLRQELPNVETELAGLGMSRGPAFAKVIEQLFQQQLLGKGRNPIDRVKLLRKLSGIKEPPKKKVKEEKKKPASKFAQRAAARKAEESAPPAGKPGTGKQEAVWPAKGKAAPQADAKAKKEAPKHPAPVSAKKTKARASGRSHGKRKKR